MESKRFTLLLFVVGCFVSAAAAAESLSPEQLKTARQAAVNRQRRVIFNNDGNEPVYLCKNTSPEELLRYRTTPLAGSQVDSIFYCTWSSGFDLFTHNTKVGHIFDTTEGRFQGNLTEKMLAAGTDPLQVMVDFGKRNNIEIFWSLRINDTHDAAKEDYGPIMFRANRLKQEHPEWLIGSADQIPKFGGWTAVDFSRPEIRELGGKYVAEVCRNYDIDGLEIDFFRHPVFFKRAAQQGTVCNDQERAWMTEFVQSVRKIVDAEGSRRGRPILLAIRVPDSVEYCRDIGIDLEVWLQQDLIDLLVVAGYFQLNPWETSVALGKKHGVKVYPSLDESRVPPEAKALRQTVESYRGRALNAWRAGVDGLYLFNSFDPNNSIWRELGSPDGLKRLNQDYFASIRGVGGAAGGALPHREYQHVPTLNPKAPLAVTAEQPTTVSFKFGNDAVIDRAKVALRLQFKELSQPSDVEVSLNGKQLGSPSVQSDWLEFAIDGSQLQADNHVRVSLTPAAKGVQWMDLHCQVRWIRSDK